MSSEGEVGEGEQEGSHLLQKWSSTTQPASFCYATV